MRIYATEREAGTELPAIIGAIQEFIENESERLRQAREAARRHHQRELQAALEERFLAGADCKWTTIQKSKDLFIRKNGRAYRLSAAKDGRLNLFRIRSVDDAGSLIGTDGSRETPVKRLRSSLTG